MTIEELFNPPSLKQGIQKSDRVGHMNMKKYGYKAYEIVSTQHCH